MSSSRRCALNSLGKILSVNSAMPHSPHICKHMKYMFVALLVLFSSLSGRKFCIVIEIGMAWNVLGRFCWYFVGCFYIIPLGEKKFKGKSNWSVMSSIEQENSFSAWYMVITGFLWLLLRVAVLEFLSFMATDCNTIFDIFSS